MKNTKYLYQHFAEEDREFVDKSLEQMQRVEDSYSFEVTSFVNPHQVEVFAKSWESLTIANIFKFGLLYE